MAVTFATNRVTVSAYKTGATIAISTTSLQITSGEIVAGDVGRFVAVKPSATESGLTQVRKITAVSGGTISISDPWDGSIASGVTWIVSHNLADVHAIGNAALQLVGNRSYSWAADWSIQSTGFLADEDISLEMVVSTGNAWPVAKGGIVQFGLLRNGELAGLETTGGCRLRFQNNKLNSSLYSNLNGVSLNGGIVNYYGCLIHSQPNGWMFQRMVGPTRFIGCNFDGPVGGRFYHPASVWVNCRMTGNNNLTPAWSIGATFNRDISDISSFRNLKSMKSYLAFGGTLRNVAFTNNTSIFSCDGSAGSVFNFVDCTEFGTADISGSGGIHNFYRSIVLKTTDSSGSSLSGVVIRVNDKNDTTQGTIQTSDTAGSVPEILARRFQKVHGSTAYTAYAPFRTRYRKYGYFWQSINAAIADPIKQATALLVDQKVTQLEATASAHTGITVVDHEVSPVSWNSKSWGITVTGDKTTNPTLTATDIEHYLHYSLSQDTSFGGKASGLMWHNLCPIGSLETENGTYGALVKGVRVVDETGNPFPGFTRMQADDGTYYTPPVQYTLTIDGFVSGSDIVILAAGTNTIIQSVDQNVGTSYPYSYIYVPETYLDIGVIKPGYGIRYVRNYLLPAANSSLPISLTNDRAYT